MLIIWLQLIFLALLHNVWTANILAIFPIPSVNPQYMLISLTEELAKHGHNITVVTANLDFTKREASRNITIIDLHSKLNRIWQKHNNNIVSDQNLDVVSEVILTLQTANHIFEELLLSVEVEKLIEEKNSFFDLLLLEASVMPLISLSHVFKAPVILVSLTGAVFDNYEIVGAQNHPFLYPSIYQRRIYNLTTWEKITETSTNIRIKLKMMSSEKKTDVMLKQKFGLDFPLINELKKNVHALFLNSNPIWAGNHPVASNVVFMPQLQPSNMENLPEDLQSYLNKSKTGVIYVSFGSNIKPSQLPPKRLLRILNILSEIPYDILLKWDNKKLPGVPKNIKIYNWLPQTSLLVHPKVKLFITQGGIQSTFEAINAGVPLIGIPVYSDQWYNTEKYINFHIGLQVDLASLTEEKLLDAINIVINDDSYRTSIKELRALMYEQPESSLARAIWCAEQVLQPYRIRHLRAPAANLSWTEYLELDFIFSLLLIVFVVILVLIVFITLIIRYILKSITDIKKKIT